MGRRPQDDHSDKLTVRESAFVTELMRTDKDRPKSITEAYSRVYSVENSAPITISNNASRVYRRKHVQAAIEKEKDRLERERMRAMRSSAVAVETALWAEVIPTNSAKDRIAALKVLAAMTKSRKDESPYEETAASKEQVIDDIKKILSDSISIPIDVTPEDSGSASKLIESSINEIDNEDSINSDLAEDSELVDYIEGKFTEVTE